MKQPHVRLGVFFLLTALLLMLGVTVVAQDVTTLTVTWWGSEVRVNKTIAVIEMFEAEHPEINIEYEYSSWGDYWTRVNTQVAGDAVACVMQQDYNYLTEWATRDLLIPLDDLLESGSINVADVNAGILDSGRVPIDDTNFIYGLSLGSNSQAYLLDVEAFEEAGLELPAWDWTWDDFEAMAYQMYDNTGRWMIAYGPWDDNSTWAMLISSGQTSFTFDGTTFGWDDPAPLVEYWTRLKRLMDYGAVPPMEMNADIVAASPSHEQSPIVRGEEAIRYQWSNQMAAVINSATAAGVEAGVERHFVLHPLPRVVGGRAANYLKPSMFFSITEGCETVDEAAMFIDFFTNDLEANEILLAERGVPIVPAVLEHLSGVVTEVEASVFEFVAAVTEDASPLLPPSPAGYTDLINNVFTPTANQVLYGEISPEEGVEIFREEGQAVLDANH